jgi:FkbM family methyltransferase
MNSQNDEERYIESFFAEQPAGSFLDIGAYDGVSLSNTYCLARKDWSGIAVEPGPSAFASLETNYARFPEVELVNAAISVDGRIRRFWEGHGEGGLYSTLNPENYLRWKGHTKFRRPYYIATMPLEVLGSVFGWGYDFISIDAEGESFELALALPLDQCAALRMLCVEHDGHTQALIDHLKPHGFSELTRNAENIIFVR